jgi:hypothetical protein
VTARLSDPSRVIWWHRQVHKPVAAVATPANVARAVVRVDRRQRDRQTRQACEALQKRTAEMGPRKGD